MERRAFLRLGLVSAGALVLGRAAPRPGAPQRPVFVDAAPDPRRTTPGAQPSPLVPAPTGSPPVSLADFPEKVVFTNAAGS